MFWVEVYLFFENAAPKCKYEKRIDGYIQEGQTLDVCRGSFSTVDFKLCHFVNIADLLNFI